MNLQEAMDVLGIEVTVMVDYDLGGYREENFPGASHYVVHFNRQVKDRYGPYGERWLSTRFSTGSAWTREPTGLEVMRLLLSEASDVRWESFEGWAANFGYGDDSIKAKATYDEIEEQTAELARFLNDDSPGEGLDERLLEWLDTEDISDESLDANPPIN